MRILIVVSILLAACTNQLQKRETEERRRNPPGTVQLKDRLYIDRTEIANVHWREFLFYTLNVDSGRHFKLEDALLDTLVWASQDQGYALSEHYFRHPSFNSYPAVGITHQQAETFCRWRTQAVNQMLTQSKTANYPFRKVLYRLPTNEEWELAAADGLDLYSYPYGLVSLYDKKGRILIHTYKQPVSRGEHTSSVKIYTSSTTAFYPNSKGIYQLQGNVSEMIADEGIAKGGNFTWPADSARVNQKHFYTKPQEWLGFRCVCEIIE